MKMKTHLPEKNINILGQVEALATEVARAMGNKDLERVLVRLIQKWGALQFIRSDHGSEFVAQELQITYA